MLDGTAAEWLLENGGPSIHYRTASELLDCSTTVHVGRLTVELLDSPLVRLWLERLAPNTGFSELHSSKPTAYENAMGKLTQLGCRSGMPPFDERAQPFRTWLEHELQKPPGPVWSPFLHMLVGTFLTMAGYHQDRSVREHLARRLSILYEFTREGDYDIYVDRRSYPGIPKGFGDKPLVNPELYPHGEERFPSIYDIHALAHYPEDLKDGATQAQIDTVVDYVLHPAYQGLPDGYGIMRAGKRRYYAIGWSIHLHGYQGFGAGDSRLSSFVQRLALLARFPTAREHRWFRESLAHLEDFRTERGTYVFPRPYLQERRTGYWVAGAYMGLEENRHSKRALELESTFWMLRIQKWVEPA